MTEDSDKEKDETPAQDSRVDLGNVSFDPVATQDFRLSVEGTSGTGKSNTLAVLLEDLADVAIPTLIIERLGALSPVRLEDEDIVVVGAREEEGVDLAVALEDLDQIGSWVLDRGMKILLDVSTYADYEQEGSRIHEAAARALRSLNDRAHEKYRAGDRTKSLLIVDEAHYMAPKDSAPEPELDEHVKRCRGQLIKVATEGGNKGISVVVGYQRRAFLHNGVIQLAQDFIAHRPGDEDIARTADALRCSEDDLAALDTGEILARGASITDGDLVGPTTVRKRRSPDPREESFELPETPEQLSEVLEDIQEDVQAERERRDQRQDELEQLREENDRLREQKEELEQELADVDRLGSALEKMSQANGGGAAAQDVGEGVADLQERVDELKTERDELVDDKASFQEDLTRKEEENQRLQEEIADLEADVQEIRSAFEGAAENVSALAETFEVDVDLSPAPTGAVDEDVTELRADLQDAHETIDQLKLERERLQEEAEKVGSGVIVPTDYEDFVDDDTVRDQIEAAKDAEMVSERYVKAIVATILEAGDVVTFSDIEEYPDASGRSHISRAANQLEKRFVISLDETGGDPTVDFNIGGIQEVKEQSRRLEKREELMEDL